MTDLFATTTDSNGRPIPAWQARLEALYTDGAPFGEILGLVRALIDERAIAHILSMTALGDVDDPERFAAKVRESFDAIAQLVRERDALRAACERMITLSSDCDYTDGEPETCPGVAENGTPCHWCEMRAALAGSPAPDPARATALREAAAICRRRAGPFGGVGTLQVLVEAAKEIEELAKGDSQ